MERGLCGKVTSMSFTVLTIVMNFLASARDSSASFMAAA